VSLAKALHAKHAAITMPNHCFFIEFPSVSDSETRLISRAVWRGDHSGSEGSRKSSWKTIR